MEEEDDSTGDPVEHREGSVERQVLLVFGHHADHPVCEYQRQDDEVRSLRDAGTEKLRLVNSFQGLVVSGSCGFDQGEGHDDKADDRDELAVEKGRVHPEPAVILPPVVVVLEAHAEHDDERRQTPSDERVLQAGEHAVLLDHVGDQGVHVQRLQHHEDEAGGEEVVDEDGDHSTQRLILHVGEHEYGVS